MALTVSFCFFITVCLYRHDMRFSASWDILMMSYTSTPLSTKLYSLSSLDQHPYVLPEYIRHSVHDEVIGSIIDMSIADNPLFVDTNITSYFSLYCRLFTIYPLSLLISDGLEYSYRNLSSVPCLIAAYSPYVVKSSTPE